MKHEIFSGVCTALVTPMRAGGLDLAALEKLTDEQISSGVSALCVAGTTGEAATLTEREWQSVLSCVVSASSGRVPVIAGVGTPSCETSCRRARMARELGANAILAVTPYYNKGTEQGIVEHFHRLAASGELPVIVYNVPTRTGRDLTPSLYLRIAEHPLIVGIKEAGGGFERLYPLLMGSLSRLALYTGNDAGILPAMAMGARGVISVVSNVLPRETVSLTEALLSGELARARELQLRMMPLIDLLFAETSPAPVKCALALLGKAEEEMRLPLAPVEEPLRRRIRSCLDTFADA